MDSPEFIVAVVTILSIFVGLPWLGFHYVTKWKQAPKITREDENLLDELYTLARRLEDRVNTVERIVAADHADFRPGLNAPAPEWKPESAARQPYSIDRRN